MVVLLINLSQNILSEVKQELDAASQKELESYIKKLVVLFNSLLGDLTHLYTKKSLITEPEPLIDPVQQFLAKESLLTSGQKEKIDRGVDEDEEDEKESIIQKDIIMYQSLSNLLMLISNLSSKVVSTEHSEASKILGSVSEALKSINTLFKSDKYSHETVNMSQRQVLKLQNSAFEKLVIRCLDKDDREILNKNLEIFLGDVLKYSESYQEKQKMILTSVDKVAQLHKGELQFYSIVIILLLKFIGENAKVTFNEHDAISKIFDIDNEEFKIARVLLYKIMQGNENNQGIKILSHVLMEVNYLATFSSKSFKGLHEKSLEFGAKKSGILFDEDFIQQAIQDAKWIEGTVETQTALSKIKYLFMILLDDILPKQNQPSEYGEQRKELTSLYDEHRHPLIQYFNTIVKGEISEQMVDEVTELILAFDFGTTLVEHQLHLINDFKKSSSGKGLVKAIQNKQFSKVVKKTAKSVERLVDKFRKLNQDFVALLIPLKVFVPVVTKILGMSDNLILLKTRSINNLSDVVLKGVHNVSSDMIESVEGGFEKSKYIDNHRIDSKLHGLFKSLISKCGEILSKYASDHKVKATHTYLQSILILIQKLLSYKNQTEIETLILPQVFIISKTEHSTMLSCSAIMFITSAFDIYKADLYRLKEDLINEVVIGQSLNNLKKVLPGGEEESMYFANSVITSILDSYCILMKSIFNQLFTPEQLSEILGMFFSIPEDKSVTESAINQNIDTITSLVAKHVNPQVSLHALFNVFDFINVKPEVYNSSEQKLDVYCHRYFAAMTKVFRNLKKDFIEDHHQGIAKFMHKAFLIPQTWEKIIQEPIIDISNIHKSVLGTFKTFILKLNEVQLKPVFTKLVKWAGKAIDSKAVRPMKDLDRLYIFFKASNCLLETLMSIFTPYLSYYIQLLTELLNEAFEENHSGALIVFMDNFTHSSHTRLNIVMVVNTLLECIRLNYYFDTESTIPVEYFQKVSDSMLHVMDFYLVKGAMKKDEYLKWIKNVYQKVIVDVLDSLDNTEITRDFLDDLLKKSKHDLAPVRLASLKITEALVYKLEERFLSLLSDLLPYISEALEDENEEVEGTARNIIQRIETMTGESIQQYLK